MAQAQAARLYSPRLLALSASLHEYPFSRHFSQVAEARSRTCGSTILLGVDTDTAGSITGIGMQVSACAVGQSSAAILAQNAAGLRHGDIVDALEEIENWLRGEGDLPHWPGFDALEPARPHAGRHEALLLPWKALIEALSTRASSG